MACHARGNRYRNGLSPVDIVRKFPDDAVVAAWTFQQRWPEGVRCPRCDSDNVQSKGKHPSMSYRCQQCRKFFSYRMGTVMQGSNLGEQVWSSPQTYFRPGFGYHAKDRAALGPPHSGDLER